MRSSVMPVKLRHRTTTSSVRSSVLSMDAKVTAARSGQPDRAISVAVVARRSMPSVISSPRRSMSPSEYMTSESPGSSITSSRGRGAPVRPAAMSNERCMGQKVALPSARTTSGGGCPALLSTTRPVEGVIVPTTAVATRSSIRASKRPSSDESTSVGPWPATA